MQFILSNLTRRIEDDSMGENLQTPNEFQKPITDEENDGGGKENASKLHGGRC